MGLPVKLINILAEQTSAENIACDDCDGTGETQVFNAETGQDILVCENCLGSGYNQLGMILQGILQPPEEGYGPVELQQALGAYMQELEAPEAQQQIVGKMGLLLYWKNYLNDLRRKQKIS